MTTVYLTRTVTGPDGEDVEIELAAEVSADGEVYGLQMVELLDQMSTTLAPVPDWALAQIDDMRDLAEDVLLKLKARETGWP